MIMRTENPIVFEGSAPFKHDTLPHECWTWYQVYGDLQKSISGRPLVVLHGGPGSNHNYLLSLADLAHDHGVPVVFYDQLGGGKSTHLREKRLDESFWTVDLFIAELDNLLEHLGIQHDFDLLGQSWGGVLGTSFAVRGHTGLKKLVVSNSPASMNEWVEACNGYRCQLSPSVNEVLEQCERNKDFANPAYKEACMIWYKQHMCRSDPWPDYVVKSFDIMDEDDTVYYTMNGPSEFTVIGSLRNFNLSGQMKHVSVPTLVLNGEYDAANAHAVAPFLRELPNVKSHTFMGCSHMCHVEDRDGYMEVVANFLKD